MNIQNLVLDINKKCNQIVTANVGEVGSRFLKINIIDNGMPVDLTGVTVYLYAKKADDTKVFNTVKVEDVKQGIVLVEITSQVLAIEGLIKLTLLLVKDNARLATKIFNLKVDETIIDDEAIESANEFGALTESLSKLGEWNSYFEETSGKIEEKYTERLNQVDSQLECIMQINLSNYGVISDGITDQTETIINLFKKDLINFKGFIIIPYNTKCNLQTVFSNCPVNAIIDDKSMINMYNSSTYKQKYYNIGGSDLVNNDTIQQLISGHHPCFVLNNLASSGSDSANFHRNSIMFAHGFNVDGTLKNHLINQVYHDNSRYIWALRILSKYNSNDVVDSTIMSIDEDGKFAINGFRNGYDFVFQNNETDRDKMSNMLISNINANSTSLLALSSKNSENVEEITQLIQNPNGDFTIQKKGNTIIKIDSEGITHTRSKKIQWRTLTGTSIDVSNGCDFFINNTSPTTLSTVNGVGNQEIRLVFQNGNTTIKNSSSIRLKGGVDWTPSQYSSIVLVRNTSITSAWLEVSRSEM